MESNNPKNKSEVMKKLAIIIVGILGWIVIITTLFSSLLFRGAYGLGLTDIIVWTIWERNDNIQPDSTKLVGAWKADDGATILLNADGTCILQNVQKYTHDPYMDEETPMVGIVENVAMEIDTCSHWNFQGYWSLKPNLSFPEKDTINYAVYMSSNPFCNCAEERRLHQRCYTLKLLIHNKKSLFSKDVTPTILYSLVGVLDPYDTYAFYKQE